MLEKSTCTTAMYDQVVECYKEHDGVCVSSVEECDQFEGRTFLSEDYGCNMATGSGCACCGVVLTEKSKSKSTKTHHNWLIWFIIAMILLCFIICLLLILCLRVKTYTETRPTFKAREHVKSELIVMVLQQQTKTNRVRVFFSL